MYIRDKMVNEEGEKSRPYAGAGQNDHLRQLSTGTEVTSHHDVSRIHCHSRS